MKMKLDAGQLLLYRAAANADRGFPSPEETAIAKAFCNQAGFDVANEALQVMGGLGYTQEELVEYCVRRCRGWMRSEEHTSELQSHSDLVCRLLLEKKKKNSTLYTSGAVTKNSETQYQSL